MLMTQPRLTATMKRWFDIFTREGMPYHVALFRALERDETISDERYDRFIAYIREYRRTNNV